jgi:hypothetical protein
MNSLGVIGCGVGLHDSINPTIFMTCAVFIAGGFWLASSSIRLFWLRVIFVLAYTVSFMEFTFGPAQVLILHKEFFLAAKVIYAVLSAGTFVLGVVFLKDWFFLLRGHEAQSTAPGKSKPFEPNGLAVLLITVLLAVLLSALDSIGPVNTYILLLGNIAVLRGQLLTVIPLMLGYVFFSIWPVWIVWAFLSIKNLKPSLRKIICASIFFTATSCIILTFR